MSVKGIRQAFLIWRVDNVMLSGQRDDRLTDRDRQRKRRQKRDVETERYRQDVLIILIFLFLFCLI